MGQTTSNNPYGSGRPIPYPGGNPYGPGHHHHHHHHGHHHHNTPSYPSGTGNPYGSGKSHF